MIPDHQNYATSPCFIHKNDALQEYLGCFRAGNTGSNASKATEILLPSPFKTKTAVKAKLLKDNTQTVMAETLEKLVSAQKKYHSEEINLPLPGRNPFFGTGNSTESNVSMKYECSDLPLSLSSERRRVVRELRSRDHIDILLPVPRGKDSPVDSKPNLPRTKEQKPNYLKRRFSKFVRYFTR